MSIQRNVAQQNAATLAEIEQTAALASGTSNALKWLPGLLRDHGQSLQDGILASLSSVPEQEGTFFHGVWLNRNQEFWAFKLTASRETGSLLELEEFENISHSIAVSARVPGTGKSFAFLAIQVLQRQLMANPSVKGAGLRPAPYVER